MNSLYTNTTGSHNVAIGLNALETNNASNNIAIGVDAGRLNTTGGNNTFLGRTNALGNKIQLRVTILLLVMQH